MRVLVADDDQLNREIVFRMLRRLGAECVLAADGEEAVALFASSGSSTFNIVFCDLAMPGIDGFETAKRLRLAGYAGSLIALTGADEDPNIYEAGFDGFLQKPVVLELLRALVEAGGADGVTTGEKKG